MVPGTSWPVRRPDRWSFWHRHCNDDRSDCRHAESLWLSAHVHSLGNHPGRRSAGIVALLGQAAGWMDAAKLERKRGEDQSESEHFGCRHDADGDATPAILLCHLCDDDYAGVRWL